MTIQEQIKKDLTTAMKTKDEERKSAIRVIMGEFGRYEKKLVPDDEVVRILKKLIKSERETIEKSGGGEDNAYIRIVESYLPKMAGEEEIEAWIREHVDFTQYKNKMQSMRDIMTHFGSTADGNMVKTILGEKF
jgi:hypothetical protein